MKVWRDGIVVELTEEEESLFNEEIPTEESEVEEDAGTF